MDPDFQPSAVPDDYVFGPGSGIWQVNRYRGGLLFGPQAVLLQVAHPRIAQGVADHSDFRGDTLGRLERTLSSVNRIAFGTHRQAERMRAHMAQVHRRVTGTISPGMTGPADYSALEPDLLLWVLATLVDASIRGYEFALGPLPPADREGFYRDMRRFGSFFGLDPGHGPPDYPAFASWFGRALDDPQLGSHPLCAEVAAAVVRPRSPLLARLLGTVVDFLPIETVPAPIRDRLGLRSTPWTRVRMRLLTRAVRPLFRVLPRRLTYYPESYRAARALGLI